MAEDFDPSPRSSKRRKTTYGAVRSILGDKQNEKFAQPTSTPSATRKSTRGNKHLNDVDEPTRSLKEGILPNEDNDQPSTTTRRSVRSTSRTDMTSKIVNTGASGGAEIVANSKNGRDAEANQDQSVEIENGTGIENTPEVQGSSMRDTPPLVVTASEDELLHEDVITQPRSSGRERKRLRRFSTSPEKPKPRKGPSEELKEKGEKRRTNSRLIGSAVESPLKGILTPSRREKRNGPRKSVVFEHNEEEIGEQLGFKDIESSMGKKTALAEPSSKGDVSMSEGEDIPVTPTKKPPRKRQTPSKAVPDHETQVETDLESDDILAEILMQTHQTEVIATSQCEVLADQATLEDDEHTITIKSIILSRIVSGGTKVIPSHLQSQYDTIHSLLRATITTGESNSLLLLGARGTGKSHLLETVVSNLAAKHADDFHTVRLNGFFQTDDKVALREIWRQLGREMQVNEMETGELGGSYADTMTSLLSLLSHPDEFTVSSGGDDHTMDVDSEAIRTSRSIVFILDEFDLFTTHPRQTLLYNLFDIAQSKKAPIAVIGCSTRMDVVDCLEKRVKSRFSHRWLHVPSAKTVGEFESMVSDILQIEEEQGIASIRSPKIDMVTRTRWNEYVQSTFMPSAQIQDLLKRTFYTTKSLPEVLTALYTPVATMRLPSLAQKKHDQQSRPTSSFTTALPSLLALLVDLPTLHLSLIIAAARLDTIHNLTTMNFNLVYAHYVELIARSRLQITASGAVAVGALLRQWNRATAKSAWEDLGAYDLIVPVIGASAGAHSALGGKDGASASDSIGGEGASVKMWRVDVTLEDAAWAVKEKWKESGGVKDVLARWCREI